LANYTNLFEFLMYVGIGAGLFVFLISPLLRRAMHGIH
jgi:POT family proton-dependent oligopeptide transporter